MAAKTLLMKVPGLFSGKVERSKSRRVPFLISLARLLLIFTLMAAPLAFGAVEVWAWAGLAVMAAVLLVVWALACVQQRVVTIHWSPLYVPAALFLTLGAVQYAGHLTLDPFATREALIKLVTDLVFFFLAVQLWAEASARAWKRLGLAIVIYAFSIALFAIVQFFTSHGLLYWAIHSQADNFGPYVNHNDYAGLMEMLVPIGMCFAIFRSLRHSSETLFIFAVCGAIASVLLSGSRGGIIAVAIEMSLLGAMIWRWNKGRGGVHKRSVIGLLGVTGAVVLFFAVTPDSAWQRLATIEGVVRKPDVTLENRLTVSRDALAEVRDYPWLGTGLGSFAAVFPQYQTFPTDLEWNHAHDDYVEALTETGIAGGLIILSSLFLFGLLAFRNLPERFNNAQGWIQLGAALGCCGLLIHSFVDFNLRIPANAAWFSVCAALSVMPLPVPRQTGSPGCQRELNQAKQPAGTAEQFEKQTEKNAEDRLVKSEK